MPRVSIQSRRGRCTVAHAVGGAHPDPNPNPWDACRCVRASKVEALWRHPPALRLLLAVGFRPLITRLPNPSPNPGAGAAQQQAAPAKDLCLVLEAGQVAVQRARAAALALSAAPQP